MEINQNILDLCKLKILITDMNNMNIKAQHKEPSSIYKIHSNSIKNLKKIKLHTNLA